jgi:uncharacterized protein
MHVEITFDPVKDAVNRAQHGFSLEVARDIAWGDAICWNDERHDYGEVREVVLGPLFGRTFCVVFTRRNEVLRIISVRRANKREVKEYEQIINQVDLSDRRGGGGNPTGHSNGPRHVRPFRSKHHAKTIRPLEE